MPITLFCLFPVCIVDLGCGDNTRIFINMKQQHVQHEQVDILISKNQAFLSIIP